MMAAGGREEVSQELVATPISSKARQKKFHRHFKTVAPDEPVLNYYSCALVADILLQGHLYITKNYFAFYSNVFGYVTKLLIPTATVVKVTKEKTAYIIPNAVGITTEEDKHVFGSLLSRDNTYKLMVQVWSAAVKQSPTHLPLVPVNKQTINEGDEATKEELEDCTDLPVLNDDESSVSGSESNLGAKLRRPLSASKANQTLNVETKSYQDVFSQTVPPKGICAHYFTYLSSVPRPTLLLVFSTVLLILLFTSAAVLLFRISRLQEGYSNSHFTTRSISEVQEFLNSNLEQISKVRQSLETLSLLIEGNTENAVGKQRWNSFSNADNNYQHNS